jgi:CRISPR-associated protein Cas2
MLPMTHRILYVAAYDIASPERLRAALAVVKGYATGRQKSVFECFLTEAERRTLLGAMEQVIQPAEDRFFLVRLDPRMAVRVLGIAIPPIDPPFFYVG